jgi:hypothetical protein
LGRISELNEAQAPTVNLEGLEELRAQFGDERLATWGANNMTPHFPAVADLAAQLYPQSGNPEIDGVITIDPEGLAAMLRAVGGVKVDSWPDPLTRRNAAQVLLHDQYTTFLDEPAGDRRNRRNREEAPPAVDPTGQGNEARQDFLGDVAEATFEKLVDGGYETPERLIKALAPAVEGRHLQIVGVEEPAASLFEAIGATGGTPPLRADSIGVIGQNFGGNKIDWFLRRTATYDVAWDPATGRVEGELEVRIRNDAPASGLPESVIGFGGNPDADQTPTQPGENLMLVSIHSALPVTTLTVDGEAVGASTAMDQERHVYTFYVSVPSHGARTIRATTSGSIGDQPYRFDPVWQPVVEPDTLTLRVRVPSGWQVTTASGIDGEGTREAAATWALDRDRAATVEAERAEIGLIRRLRGGP